MTTWINIFAMILLSVVPYLRPCNCSGFTLFCQCAVTVEAESDGVASDVVASCAVETAVQNSEPDRPPCCCCHEEAAGADTQAAEDSAESSQPSHKPDAPPHRDEDKPCQRSMMPEATAAVLTQPVADAAVSQSIFAVLPVTLTRPQAVPPQTSPCSPRAPPGETGILAFRTNFLLI